MVRTSLITLSLALLFSFSTWAADDVLQVTSDGVSQSDVPAKARSESLKNAMDKGCLQVISNLIGEGKIEKNMAVIQTKILSQTSKFIQYYKASEPIKKEQDTVTSVTVKISVPSLRDLLAQEGLLYQSEGPATILPVIRFADKKEAGRAYSWWTDEATPQNAFLREESRQAVKSLEGVLRPKNFYVIDPVSQHYVQWLPSFARVESPNRDELFWMGEFYRGQIVMQGDFTVEPGSRSNSVRLIAKIVAYHAGNGRVIADVARNIEGPAPEWDFGVQQIFKRGIADISKELSAQIFDEWSKGSMGSQLLMLSLKGQLNYQDIESFKKQILTRIGDVKTIRERRLESGMTTFEVDAAGGLANLVKKLEGSTFDGFGVRVDHLDTNQVTLKWNKTTP